jgi:ribosomal protein S18 acetylase RimI-like enzyme
MISIEILKSATPSQFSDISRLLSQLHAGSSTAYEPTADRLRALLADHNADIVVALDNERIIGMALLFTLARIDETSGYVDDVVVDDAYRGQGIATRILERVVSRAKERNHTHIDLTSRPSREAANHLYQKIGFVKRETNPYRLKI